jgi:hypothetical protein
MIRTDDDSHYSILRYNLLLGTTGKDGLCMKGFNIFENNFFFNSRFTTGMAGNKAEYSSSFRKNVFYSTGDINDFHYKTHPIGPYLNENLYFSNSPESANKFLAKTRKLQQDTMSLFADPKFANIANFDLSFEANSPAYKLGIQGLSPKQIKNIGVNNDPWYKRSKLPVQWNDEQGDYHYFINKIKKIH